MTENDSNKSIGNECEGLSKERHDENEPNCLICQLNQSAQYTDSIQSWPQTMAIPASDQYQYLNYPSLFLFDPNINYIALDESSAQLNNVFNQSCVTLFQENIFNTEEKYGQPFISNENTIRIKLVNGLTIDIGVNRAVRVTNIVNANVISINFSGSSTAIDFGFGRIFQNENELHFENDTKNAKICENGIHFKSKLRSMSYIVDESGCKSTKSKYIDLYSQDYSFQVFHNNANIDKNCDEILSQAISRSIFRTDQRNYYCWQISGVRTRVQSSNGNLRITKAFGRIAISVLPLSGRIQVLTPYFKIDVNNNFNQHLVIRKIDSNNEIKIVSNINCFDLQFGSQKAGLDHTNRICIN